MKAARNNLWDDLPRKTSNWGNPTASRTILDYVGDSGAGAKRKQDEMFPIDSKRSKLAPSDISLMHVSQRVQRDLPARGILFESGVPPSATNAAVEVPVDESIEVERRIRLGVEKERKSQQLTSKNAALGPCRGHTGGMLESQISLAEGGGSDKDGLASYPRNLAITIKEETAEVERFASEKKFNEIEHLKALESRKLETNLQDQTQRLRATETLLADQIANGATLRVDNRQLHWEKDVLTKKCQWLEETYRLAVTSHKATVLGASQHLENELRVVTTKLRDVETSKEAALNDVKVARAEIDLLVDQLSKAQANSSLKADLIRELIAGRQRAAEQRAKDEIMQLKDIKKEIEEVL